MKDLGNSKSSSPDSISLCSSAVVMCSIVSFGSNQPFSTESCRMTNFRVSGKQPFFIPILMKSSYKISTFPIYYWSTRLHSYWKGVHVSSHTHSSLGINKYFELSCKISCRSCNRSGVELSWASLCYPPLQYERCWVVLILLTGNVCIS